VRILLLNQTFHPDVVATGQYLTELAIALAGRGHEVTVVTGRRAYDHPDRLFPKTENWRGVRIIRIASTGFGKDSKLGRALDFASFLLNCALRLAVLPRQDAVLALTSPPLISFLGACFAKLRGGEFFYWVMDFNPDEAIAAGWLRPNSLAARILEAMSLFSLRRAKSVYALDRFMRDRIVAKGFDAEKVRVIPPWSHDEEVKFDAAGRERFRRQHGLDGEFVVMYSGNHSPCHPLSTLLAAAERLRGDPDIVFCFVGGGSEWREIQTRFGPGSSGGTGRLRLAPNILLLPYEPLAELAGSLSAADLHVVVMGEPFVGLIHPCKIYNALAVGAPLLCVGPTPSHLSEITARLGPHYPCAMLSHGDVEGVVDFIRATRAQGNIERPIPSSVLREFSKETCLPKFVEELVCGGTRETSERVVVHSDKVLN
jgi:glycosyltransferase involved in cell wall biosynthesis